MKIRCDYCNNFISDTDVKCPNCGAPNSRLMRSAQGVPKTVAELETFCRGHGMDLERMRFFLGKDIREPRAFGIYQEADGDFIVYKNKADGSRAVRYRGKDEAYAVNELYQKLKGELSNRRAGRAGRTIPPPAEVKKPRKLPLALIVIALLLALGVGSCVKAINETPNGGYYSYDGDYYYNDYSSWYLYDDASLSWLPAAVDSVLTDNYADYWQGYDYDYDYEVQDFEEGRYYSEPAQSDSDSGDWDSDWDDSDWDYDYDSWDSGDTDWDSDW